MSTAASIAKSAPPIPTDLPQFLHFPKTPWHISPDLFERIKKQQTTEVGKPFVAVQVTSNDPEYAFVLRYFQYQKPPHYSIKSIRCIHNPDQTKAFEVSFTGMEVAAKTFPPNWSQEEPKDQRAQTIERWKASVAPFSPFQIPSSKRVDSFVKSKIVPLWHGSKQAESICSSGFTYFGKHHFFDKSAKAGSQASTDIGFFGSGIYFTNSPHYASMYHSGSLILSWVSMREPYPVVNDVPIPKKGTDMIKLQGKGAYQNYNAHYIPVTSTDPSSPDNMIYHPCHVTEVPAWDEYVVFERTQALPRFIVELGVDLPVTPSSPSVENVGTLLEKVLALLDNTEIQCDKALSVMLSKKSEALLSLNAQNSLSPEEITFYNCIKNLLDPSGKIRSVIKQQLTKSQSVTNEPNAKENSSIQPKIIINDTAASASTANRDPRNEKMNETVAASNSIDLKSLEKTDADGRTPLLNAAKEGKVELCKTLLEAGASPNATDKNGYNALHLAAETDKHEVIPLFAEYKYLLKAEANISNKRWTPLMVGASNGNSKVCEALLAMGADPNAIDIHCCNVFHIAAKKGKHEVIPVFSTYKQLLNSKDSTGLTPLILAAWTASSKETCKALLVAGADPTILDDMRGGIVLHWVALNGNHELIPIFAPYKQLFNAKDKKDITPLMCAINEGHLKACEALLLAGADPSITDKRGKNCFAFATESTSSFKDEILKLLQSNIAQKFTNSPVAIKSNTREDPHATAAAATTAATAASRNTTPKANSEALNAKDKWGHTPLYNAAGAYINKEVTEKLLKEGADPSIIDKLGENPIHHAARASNDAVIGVYKGRKELLNAKDNIGWTPLMHAAEHGRFTTCEALLKAGAEPSITNKQGQKALDVATSSTKHTGTQRETIAVLKKYDGCIVS